ncbi:hypothetical protein NOR51B_235 [Luminiphilus syltensis NOR5-1B]|uniref:Uncharacterized protein n=1 Tax=Luminiphilus syltensis NOR5-1B TaxID=565045 RepID=B8KXT2_9GAMM|nr:hypothetical protein NOR51B_235 [Luminiphilus syltensis NOR5-1B]
MASALIIGLVLTGCSSGISTGGYNPTTVPADFNAELTAASEINTVVVASVNLGPPSRSYLDKQAPRIDRQVTEYLKDNGYQVLPQREFSQRWNNLILVYGDPVDPTTGRVNMKTFIQIMQGVRDQMKEQTSVDAFVFTDIIEREVIFDQGINRVARWDGVSRKPALRGAGTGVSTAFNWAEPVSAASIQISIYNMDLQKLFAGVGGMELNDAVDTRSGNGFIRRREILDNDNFIQEGIALALHPLIVMDDWPGEAD